MDRSGNSDCVVRSAGSHGSQVIMGIEPLASALASAPRNGSELSDQLWNHMAMVNGLRVLCCSSRTPLMSRVTDGSQTPAITPLKAPVRSAPRPSTIVGVAVGAIVEDAATGTTAGAAVGIVAIGTAVGAASANGGVTEATSRGGTTVNARLVRLDPST